jgi:hypothetical protein
MYVTLEMVNFTQAAFINTDKDMYDPEQGARQGGGGGGEGA